MSINKTKYIEARAKGANKTEAALQAGAKNTVAARKAGYRLSQQTEIQKRIDTAIRRNEVDLEYLIRVYTDAVKATKTSTAKDSGKVYDSGIPDHTTRMKAADKLLSLSGIETRLEDITPTSQNVVEQINSNLLNGDEVELQKVVFRKQAE